MTLSRRSLITGLVSFVAAPAIVRCSSLMPVKMWPKHIEPPFVYLQTMDGTISAFSYETQEWTNLTKLDTETVERITGLRDFFPAQQVLDRPGIYHEPDDATLPS
jgi:hypothetical protein